MNFLLLFTFSAALLAQDIGGTYTGTLKANDGSEGSGTIIVKQEGNALTITAGPQLQNQSPATKVERDGEIIRFELAPDGDPPRTMRFAVTIKDGKLTGKVTMMREGESDKVGQLDLVKQ